MNLKTIYASRKPGSIYCSFSQGYKDSNLEMTESESAALPFGYTPLLKFSVSDIIRKSRKNVNGSFQKSFQRQEAVRPVKI